MDTELPKTTVGFDLGTEDKPSVASAVEHPADSSGAGDVTHSDNGEAVRPLESQGPLGPEMSIVDALKQELNELVSAKDVNIPVKGYEKIGLQIKYHFPEKGGRELDEIRRKVERETRDPYDRNLLVSMDTMIHLCDGLYVQPDGVDEPVMLDPDETGMPVAFDERLAEVVGLTTAQITASKYGPSRTVLRRLFGNNDNAIMTHSERLSRWLQNTKADVNAELWQLGD